MGGKVVDEDKARLTREPSNSSRDAALKLQLERPAQLVAESEEEEDDNDQRPILASSSSGNVYMDSPRATRFDDDVTDEEKTRRHRVGVATVMGLFISVMLCIAMLHYLSHHESFSALPPTQQRLMSSTTAAGARETLEQYTAGTRHTGTTGDQEMAKYIRTKAIDFGIEERFIKMEEFEILTNEPESLKLQIGTAKKYDFMANYTSAMKKNNARMPFPPFHLYSKNGSVTGKLVYAHYGRTQDYAALAKAGVNASSCVVLVRMGGGVSLPAKVVLAGNHGAIGVLTYSDPFDDGAARGKTYPDGPWRVASEASYGSVYMGNGDPSTPDGFSGYAEDRITVDEVFSSNNTYNIIPQVVSMPVSAQVAGELLDKLGLNATLLTAAQVFPTSSWFGGAATSSKDGYRVGPSDFSLTLENKNKYSLKKVWNVLVTVPGSREADRYVMVGAPRDSLNAGAVSPGSGNAVFIELLRAIGDLLTSGWVPHRTLLLASFDGEQYGSVGSSEWIDRHFSHLGGRGVVYLHLRDIVKGAGALHCEAAASLRKTIYLMSTEIVQPKAEVNVESFFSSPSSPSTGGAHRMLAEDKASSFSSPSSTATTPEQDLEDDAALESSLLPLNTTFSREDLKDSGDSVYAYWLHHTQSKNPSAKIPKIDLPGADNKISPFLARLGIPSLELGFDKGYFGGVDGTKQDSFDWIKKFVDPSFTFHRAAAQLYGSIMLSFSDAVFLPYDFTEVARDLRYGEAYLQDALKKQARSAPLQAPIMNRLAVSIKKFEVSAVAVAKEIRDMRGDMVNLISGELIVDLKKVREMNTRLLMTEKAFMLPAGLPKMPWLKHALYGISEYDDFRVGYFPSVAQEIHSGNAVTIKRELIRLCQIIEQTTDILSTPVI